MGVVAAASRGASLWVQGTPCRCTFALSRVAIAAGQHPPCHPACFAARFGRDTPRTRPRQNGDKARARARLAPDPRSALCVCAAGRDEPEFRRRTGADAAWQTSATCDAAADAGKARRAIVAPAEQGTSLTRSLLTRSIHVDENRCWLAGGGVTSQRNGIARADRVRGGEAPCQTRRFVSGARAGKANVGPAVRPARNATLPTGSRLLRWNIRPERGVWGPRRVIHPRMCIWK